MQFDTKFEMNVDKDFKGVKDEGEKVSVQFLFIIKETIWLQLKLSQSIFLFTLDI